MASHKDSSVLAFEKKLERNPVSLVFSRLADCYRKRGDIQQAIDVCSSGLAHHPDSITGRIILGRCYLEQEKLKEALQEFINVIGRDRGNQVAVKMLADIYARQGMKDKAGDLYAYLFARDPDNPSLDNLTKSYGGTGKTNIYQILGFSLPKPDAVKASGREIFAGDGGSVQGPDRVDTALEKTMKFDAEELKAGVAPQEAGAFAQQTLQYDADELKPGAGQAYEVEEIVGDVARGENQTITGDDVSNRMAMMFEEEGPTTGSTDFVSEVIGISREDAAGSRPAASIDAGTPPSPVLEISGSDISSRIDQLFIEKREEEAGSQQDYTQMFDAPPLQVSDTPLSVDTGEEPVGPEVLSQADSSDISGEDVVSRMTEMFERPGDKGSQEVKALMPESGETVETPPTMSLEEVSEEARPSDGVREEAAIAEAARSEGAETPEVVFETAAQPGIPDASISGDDIAQRLESIFEEEPVDVQAPLETAPTPSAPRSSEEDIAVEDALSNGIDDAIEAAMAAEATVIQEPPAGEGDAAEGPRIDNERKEIEDTDAEGAIEATIQESVEKVDDTLPGDDTPEMSGNDVLTRLDELFPEAMLTNETLSMVAEIPEGDKDEESVNQGFYTMSGENAETAQSKEPLLEKLDDVEIEIPFKADDMEEIVAGEDSFAEYSKASPEAEKPKEYSIPDHVLTPTLADIYFQQGQPQLAVEIYERLLRKDPDNERIRRRIDEIKKHIVLSGDQAPVKKGKPEAKKAPAKAAVSRTDRSASTPKPLAGVRIKKSFKKKPKER